MHALLISAFFIVFAITCIIFAYSILFISPTVSLITVTVLIIAASYYDYKSYIRRNKKGQL